MKQWLFEVVATVQRTLNVVRGLIKRGVTGISVECAVRLSIAELASSIPHGQVGVTTVGEVRRVGGDVIRTSGRSLYHATLTGLTPEDISRLFTPTIPNPAQQS